MRKKAFWPGAWTRAEFSLTLYAQSGRQSRSTPSPASGGGDDVAPSRRETALSAAVALAKLDASQLSRSTLYIESYRGIMSDPHIEIPARAPAATSADDTILPVKVEALDLRGRVVRFGPAIDTILSRHRYPAPVAKLLGEAIVLTVLLGSTLKSEGRFILQTQSDGPVRMLVIDYTPA